jgi:hypothetical protein
MATCLAQLSPMRLRAEYVRRIGTLCRQVAPLLEVEDCIDPAELPPGVLESKVGPSIDELIETLELGIAGMTSVVVSLKNDRRTAVARQGGSTAPDRDGHH